MDKEISIPGSITESMVGIVKGFYGMQRSQDSKEALQLLGALVRQGHFACDAIFADVVDTMRNDPSNEFSYEELDVFDAEGKGKYLNISDALRNQACRMAFYKRLDRIRITGGTRQSIKDLISEYVQRGKVDRLEFRYPQELEAYIQYCADYIGTDSKT